MPTTLRRSRASTLVLCLALAPALAFLPTDTASGQPAASQPSADLLQVRKLVDHAEYDEAEVALKPLLAQKPAQLLMAEIQLRRGRYAEAAATAKGVSSEKSLANDAAALRAEALASVGKMSEAIQVLRDVEQDPDARRARLLLGEYLIAIGKRGDARAPLMTLISDYNTDAINSKDAVGISMVGRAAHLLRSAKDANEAFNDAEKAGAKTHVETLLWRSELFLDKYDPGHAGQVVEEATKLAPADPRVRVAFARVKLENSMDFDGAEHELERALRVNPNLAEAYFVQAGLSLRDLDIEAADRSADQGLKTNPNDLELLSMKAAIRFLADDQPGFLAFKKKVFELNPEYSSFFQIVGDYAEWEHRYDDIVAFMREAVVIDGRDAKAYATLGLNLIRAGKEDEGLEALRKAWDFDKFNVRVFNTLNLYEKDIANDYVTATGQTFRIRYNKAERAILERYVPRMLEEAWGSMVKRYHFTPSTPVSIELYADSEHFSVRTSGLPEVGIQGVCFGHTLALMSPHAAPFNWGNVLWHELGHVFAIQLSKNHVPRWYTEGLSEYETLVRRPEWQREEDPALFAALKAGKVPAVAAFNKAFTHVDNIEDVTMAYYAASQIIVFLVDRYGFDKTISMLPKWGSGERTPAVVKEALGVSAEELDKEYRAWLATRLTRYDKTYVPNLHAPPLEDAKEAAAKDPKNGRKSVELGLALLKAGKQTEGAAILSQALTLDPKNADAAYVLADLALEDEKFDEAAKLLQGLVSGGHDGFSVRMKLAVIAKQKKDDKGIIANLWAAYKCDPTQSEPLAHLVEIFHRTRDGAAEIDVLRKLVLLEQHDREAWDRLLEGLVARGQWEEAVKVGESTLFVDVTNPEVHRLYARALARTGKFVSAIYEYNSAIISGAEPDKATEIYRELAKAYDKLGQPKLAEDARGFEKVMEKRAAEASDDDSDRPRPGKHGKKTSPENSKPHDSEHP
jgi:tetratricopeptide (TPR) repeat protein